MKGKYIRTTIMAIFPGAVLGFVLYSIASQGMLLVACILAGIIFAIPTGMLYYIRAEGKVDAKRKI